MLIEFRVENHRSLRGEQVVPMEAGRVGDETDPRPRKVPGYSEKLLTVMGLYGANASGKSNVLGAFVFMREAVLRSYRLWPPDGGVPRDPFAWEPKDARSSLFEVMFILDGVRYQYGFAASDTGFLEEWLYAWPHGKKQIWFEREGAYKFGESLSGENKLIAEVTRPNALFLSVAAQHNHPQLKQLFSWFQSIRVVNFSGGTRSERFRTMPVAVGRSLENEAFDARQGRLWPDEESSSSLQERFLDLLRTADLGIEDLRLATSADDSPSFRTIQLKHKNPSGNAWLPLREESSGTQTMFSIALPVLEALDHGDLVLIDELERSLHPSLAAEIIRRFNDPATNPKNAQIIFTTHDTGLIGTTLGEPVLRRDQVLLTEKDDTGATVVYPLTDFKPRKAENLERGYLQGRYGAVPYLGSFAMSGN